MVASIIFMRYLDRRGTLCYYSIRKEAVGCLLQEI